MQNLILDGHKLAYHKDRVEAWLAGERIAPITIDIALSRACNFRCEYCYGVLQENPRQRITQSVIDRFLEDAAEIGVRAISFISDGESTLNRHWVHAITYGKNMGLNMGLATNGYLVTPEAAEEVLPCLDYIRINISAGNPQDYSKIMGVRPEWFFRVVENTKAMVAIKKRDCLPVTIGIQQVLMPHYGPLVLELARLGQELGVDYTIIKHCSDDELGSLGIDYSKYAALTPLLEEAEALSTENYLVKAKWSKILAGGSGNRTYSRCYGPVFMPQFSGSGLVSPCGMLFNRRYAKKFHIGNIAETSFKEIWQGERYWEVMRYLASEQFDARTACGCLCLQHVCNIYLDSLKQGKINLEEPTGEPPLHLNFV